VTVDSGSHRASRDAVKVVRQRPKAPDPRLCLVCSLPRRMHSIAGLQDMTTLPTARHQSIAESEALERWRCASPRSGAEHRWKAAVCGKDGKQWQQNRALTRRATRVTHRPVARTLHFRRVAAAAMAAGLLYMYKDQGRHSLLAQKRATCTVVTAALCYPGLRRRQHAISSAVGSRVSQSLYWAGMGHAQLREPLAKVTPPRGSTRSRRGRR